MNEEYQEDYEQASMPAPNYNMQALSGHSSEGSLRFQLESQDVIQKIIRRIRGEIIQFDENGNEKIVQHSEPLVNERGIAMIEGYLAGFLENVKTFALSELDEEYIFEEVRNVGHDLIAEFQDNWVNYDIKSTGSASYIVRIVTANVYAVLNKGKDLNFMKYLSKTTQSIEHSQFQQQRNNPQMEQKKGFLGLLGLGKR